jgi:hypothetical protein
MNTAEVICSYCNREYTRIAKYVVEANKKGWRQTCSSKCEGEIKREGKTLKCFTCDKKIYISNSRAKKSKSGKFFCSRSCATVENNKLKVGENHPHYIGASYRKIAFDNFKHKCYFCEYDDPTVLQVHHIDENRKNNSLDNLLIVCPTHHIELHRGVIKLNRG